MRLLFTFLLFTPILIASNILSTKIDLQPSFVDLFITFDTPFEGDVRQSRRENTIVIRLTEATIESPSIDKLPSAIAKKVAITPLGDQTQIVVDAPAPIVLNASKSSDSYGLKLRISEPPVAAASLRAIPEKQFEGGYLILIALLVVGIAILFWLKRPVFKSADSPDKPRLFGKKKRLRDEATVRFQKPIDPKNSIAMIDYAGESYLVVLGTTNLLLDKFRGNKAVHGGDLEQLLQAKQHEINAFLGEGTVEENVMEALESYKAKASGE